MNCENFLWPFHAKLQDYNIVFICLIKYWFCARSGLVCYTGCYSKLNKEGIKRNQ